MPHGLTLVFETFLGRVLGGKPWPAVEDYNVLAGRIWLLVPLWTLVAPYMFSVGPSKGGEGGGPRWKK
jgi:hypothetical protein